MSLVDQAYADEGPPEPCLQTSFPRDRYRRAQVTCASRGIVAMSCPVSLHTKKGDQFTVFGAAARRRGGAASRGRLTVDEIVPILNCEPEKFRFDMPPGGRVCASIADVPARRPRLSDELARGVPPLDHHWSVP